MNNGLPTYWRILVALDDSPIAEQVLQYALSMAKACGAKLTLLRVIPPTLLDLATGAAKPEQPARDEEAATASRIRRNNRPHQNRCLAAWTLREAGGDDPAVRTRTGNS